MPLPQTASHWYEEIRRSEEQTAELTWDYADEIERLHGSGYREHAGATYNPENHAAEFIALTLPLCAASDPRFRWSSSRLELQPYARAFQFAHNRWARETRQWALEERFFVDYSIKYPVSYVALGPRVGFEGWGDPPQSPRMGWVDPRLFGWDPAACGDFMLALYAWHMEVAMRSDLLEDAEANPKAGWIVDNIKAAGENIGLDIARPRDPGVPDRHEIVYYLVHVRKWKWEGNDAAKYKPENGYNGAVLTLGYCVDQGDEGDGEEFDEEGEPYAAASSGNARGVWLREPQPFFGPPEGPYTVGGWLSIPGEVARLSPVGLVREQVDSLNTHVRGMIRSMADYKRLALVSDQDPDLAETIQSGQHHGVYPVSMDEIRNAVVQLEVAGTTEQHHVWSQTERDRLNRNSGINDLQRGMNIGAGTATEARIATGAGNIRTAHHNSKFRKFMEESNRKVGWYLWASEKVEQGMGQEASGAFVDIGKGKRIVDPIWQGGPGEDQTMEQVLTDWASLDMSIERYSLGLNDDDRQSFLLTAVQQTIAEVAAITETYPWVRVEEYVEWKSELLGIPELQRLFDYEKGRALGLAKLQLNIQANAEPFDAAKAGAQPRTSSDRIGGHQGSPTPPQGKKPAAPTKALGAGPSSAAPSSGSAAVGGRSAKGAGV